MTSGAIRRPQAFVFEKITRSFLRRLGRASKVFSGSIELQPQLKSYLPLGILLLATRVARANARGR